FDRIAIDSSFLMLSRFREKPASTFSHAAIEPNDDLVQFRLGTGTSPAERSGENPRGDRRAAWRIAAA
ncbi:hypothetical protein, partial [Rhodoblastus sp.]|uniref:hypothetical protein n=1 Tax=Rhodoblastus sp. TaxID=1962975 RepID=UPI0035B4C8CC